MRPRRTDLGRAGVLDELRRAYPAGMSFRALSEKMDPVRRSHPRNGPLDLHLSALQQEGLVSLRERRWYALPPRRGANV